MTDDKPQRHVASHVFNLVAMAAGGIGLAWMLHELGWSQVTDALDRAGGWFWLILALDLSVLCLDAAALRAFMRPEARMVSYWRVLGAQASGRAISVLTPTGTLGEPTKLAMLVTHAPRDRVLSSLVLLNLSQLYLSVTIIAIGTPIMFLLIDVPHAIRVGVLIGLAILLPLMVALAVIVRRGAITTLVDLIRSTRLISDQRAASWRTRMAEVDGHIRELQTNRSAGTWKGILWVGGSKVVSSSSTFLLLYLIGIDVGPTLIVAMLSVGILIQWFANIVPMGLAVADGGNYALFSLVGQAGTAGVVITMLDRVRAVAIAILGLGAMAVMHAINRLAVAKIHRRLEELREHQS